MALFQADRRRAHAQPIFAALVDAAVDLTEAVERDQVSPANTRQSLKRAEATLNIHVPETQFPQQLTLSCPTDYAKVLHEGTD